MVALSSFKMDKWDMSRGATIHQAAIRYVSQYTGADTNNDTILTLRWLHYGAKMVGLISCGKSMSVLKIYHS